MDRVEAAICVRPFTLTAWLLLKVSWSWSNLTFPYLLCSVPSWDLAGSVLPSLLEISPVHFKPLQFKPLSTVFAQS